MVSEKLILCEYSVRGQLEVATSQLLIRHGNVVTANVCTSGLL